MSDEFEKEPELSSLERRNVRLILANDEKRKWLWANIRSIAAWTVGVITAITMIWTTFKSAIKAALT